MRGVAVVTGSSGFIGTTLVERLVQRGFHVRCLVRRASPRRRDLPNVERVVVDLTDASALERSTALAGARLVFHLAGATTALTLQHFRDANVVPATALLRALARSGDVERVLLVSSQAAAGPARSLDEPVTEDDPPRPIEAYGRSKLEAEAEARRWSDRVPLTIVRPCSVYGPGDLDFFRLFRMAQQRLLLYPGTRDSFLSLLHVDDVADGLIAAATTPAAAGATLFLANDRPVRWSEIGESVASVVGVRARSIDVPHAAIRALVPFGEAYARLTGRRILLNRHKVALSAPRYWVCSGARAARLLGFAPRWRLADGLRATYCWYVRNGWLRDAAALRPTA